ncbi:MAG: hypothetical protein Q8S31_05175 [Alphaproteobacteria bacterium]|nr:hypothetical protein [Alphaproteobacteria bacterium]
MLKTITKYCAIIFLFSASNEAFSTEIYTKMMPDYESIRKLEETLLPILKEANEQARGELVYNSDDWHMTIQPRIAPDYLSKTELRDWSTEDARQFNLKNLSRQLKNVTDVISNIDFKINGVAAFGGRNKFIVLTLEPILDHIENKSLKKKIRKRILESKPHISLSRYTSGFTIATHEMLVSFNKALDIIENNNIKIRFDKVVAEAQKDSPICIYTVPNRVEIADH